MIIALKAGQQFSVNNTNNLLPNTGGGYSVSLVNGMLKFNSSDGMLNFLNALDTAISNWDTNADPELEGLPSEKNLAGDPTKNAFDSAMGFKSLRKNYEMAYYDDPSFQANLSVKIDEEDTRTVLNENNEVQIGTTIYKFMGTNIIAEIVNEDYTTLQFLRDHPGLINNSPNLTLKDITTGLKLPQSDIVFGTCVITVVYAIQKNINGDFRQIQLRMIPVATPENGPAAFCGYYYYVKWGDGFETSPFNLVPTVNHTYNASPAPGQCQSYNMSIKVTAITCNNTDCNNKVGTANPTVAICNAVPGCGKNTSSVPSQPNYFTYGGINYRIIGEVGAQHATSIWPRRNMIYSRTFWQKQNSNGNWYPTKNRKAWLTARVYGPVFLNDCSTTSPRDRATSKRNQVHMEVNDVIGETFGYTRIDPNLIKSDHYLFIDIGAGYTVSILGHKLQ